MALFVSLAVDRRRPNHALPLTDSGSVRHQLAGRPQGEARTPTRSEQARQGQQARAGAGLEWDAERARPVRGEVVELLRGHCAFNHLHDQTHRSRTTRGQLEKKPGRVVAPFRCSLCSKGAKSSMTAAAAILSQSCAVVNVRRPLQVGFKVWLHEGSRARADGRGNEPTASRR